MAKITKEQYECALARIEELLPMVDDNTPANDRNACPRCNGWAGADNQKSGSWGRFF